MFCFLFQIILKNMYILDLGINILQKYLKNKKKYILTLVNVLFGLFNVVTSAILSPYNRNSVLNRKEKLTHKGSYTWIIKEMIRDKHSFYDVRWFPFYFRFVARTLTWNIKTFTYHWCFLHSLKIVSWKWKPEQSSYVLDIQ